MLQSGTRNDSSGRHIFGKFFFNIDQLKEGSLSAFLKKKFSLHDVAIKNYMQVSIITGNLEIDRLSVK